MQISWVVVSAARYAENRIARPYFSKGTGHIIRVEDPSKNWQFSLERSPRQERKKTPSELRGSTPPALRSLQNDLSPSDRIRSR